MSIVEFILARIADDEQTARSIHRDDCDELMCDECTYGPFPCDCGQPARVLRQCAALRKVVDAEIDNLYRFDGEWGDGCELPTIRAGLCDGDAALDESTTLRALACIWSDHPDHREEWSAA